jgi:hypothetical protein
MGYVLETGANKDEIRFYPQFGGFKFSVITFPDILTIEWGQ